MSITAILNIYKRPQHLPEQLDAISGQTVPPETIILWNNGFRQDFSEYKTRKRILFFDCSENLGVWARFFAALAARTEFICIFDDDTIPGRKWFENCLSTMATVGDGILGPCGMIFQPGNLYAHSSRVGWVNPNEEIAEVDAVCHSWFLRRKNLTAFLNDLPDTRKYSKLGEDLHLSYAAQKYRNLKTYVPPHPKEDAEMWGSDPKKGWEYGTEPHAISVTTPFSQFTEPFQRLLGLGFETIANRARNKK